MRNASSLTLVPPPAMPTKEWVMEPSPEPLVIQTDCETTQLENKPRFRAGKLEKIRRVPFLIRITEGQFMEQLEQKVPVKTKSSH